MKRGMLVVVVGGGGGEAGRCGAFLTLVSPTFGYFTNSNQHFWRISFKIT